MQNNNIQTRLTEERVKAVFGNMAGKRIAVIGDVMLDQYYWGAVSRISPEAPVPVVDVKSDSVRLGGAANVAHNILSLGAETLLIGIVGNDRNGKLFSSLMRESGFLTDGLIEDPSRPTTIKTRVIANNQHVVRFDRESDEDISSSVKKNIVDIFKHEADSFDAIILQDYNKGALTADTVKEIIEIANSREKIIAVDPKFKNFFEYKNVTLFKPNRRELEMALGVKTDDDIDIERAGIDLMKRISAENVLITRGAKGMTLIEKNGNVHNAPTSARSVLDVSGAGDTVIATVAATVAGGANMIESSLMANFAAGLVCEEAGIVPVSRDKLIGALLKYANDHSQLIESDDANYG